MKRGRQLVRLRQRFKSHVESLHQWRAHYFRPQGSQVLEDDPHFRDTDFAVHAVQDDGLEALDELGHRLIGQSLFRWGTVAPVVLGMTLPMREKVTHKFCFPFVCSQNWVQVPHSIDRA